jgi:hypothetical protein
MEFEIIELTAKVPQRPTVEFTKRGFIRWGNDNDYPQQVAEMVNFSTTHQAIIKSKAILTAGTGFVGLPEVDEFNKDTTESLNDVLRKVAADQVTFKGFALQIIWTAGQVNGAFRISEIHHLDFSKIRLGVPNENGIIESVFVSADWTARRASQKQIPIYNPENAATEKLQILYVTEYTPGLNFYPSPDYSAAINYINLDYEVSKYHINYVCNGMTPGVAVMVPEMPNEEERRKLKRDLQNRYTGTDNAGRIMVFFAEDADNMVKVQDIASGGSADIYNALNDITTQKIITGHRLTSPVLAGLSGGVGNLGSNGSEIATAHEIFLKSVIEPSYQMPIIEAFEMLFLQNGVDVELSIENKQPVQNIFSESLLADIATTDELREMAGLPPLGDVEGDVINDGAEDLILNNNLIKN